MELVTVTLIGKPGCHLCDAARSVITAVTAQFDAGGAGPRVELEEKSILDDNGLYEKYVEEIPVVLIDGRMHTYWRVDPARLTNALLEKQ